MQSNTYRTLRALNLAALGQTQSVFDLPHSPESVWFVFHPPNAQLSRFPPSEQNRSLGSCDRRAGPVVRLSSHISFNTAIGPFIHQATKSAT